MNSGDIITFDAKKNFTFIKKLGGGGTGDTHLFKDETTDMFFAIKKYVPKDLRYIDDHYNNDYGVEENVILGDSGFEELFYSINDYLETIIECYAQYLVKSIEHELVNKKEKIDNLIKNAEIRAEKSKEAGKDKVISDNYKEKSNN